MSVQHRIFTLAIVMVLCLVIAFPAPASGQDLPPSTPTAPEEQAPSSAISTGDASYPLAHTAPVDSTPLDPEMATQGPPNQTIEVHQITIGESYESSKPKPPAIQAGDKLVPNLDSPPAPLDSPKPSSSAPTAWSTIMTEGFEGAFPAAGWTVYDGDGATNGEYYWDDDDYMAHAASWSAWAANGGANGLDPASYYYPNYTLSYMVYGPFSLADAVDAELQFYYWNQSEPGWDYFGWYASVNGTNFSGNRVSGDSGGWVSINFDLTNVPSLGNLAGRSSVWIAFIFTSDVSNVDDGPFVDDISLWKDTTPPELTPYTPYGWGYPIVPSSITGTHTVNALYTNRITYLDWAIVNTGGNATTSFVNCLYYDGVQFQCFNTNSLQSNYYTFVLDWVLAIIPTIGNHTLRITADVTNVIAESNETNNSWEGTFAWHSPVNWLPVLLRLPAPPP